MTITELKKLLKRGVRVTVRDTFENDELHGLTMYIKSKKPAVCKKQAGQCAEDRKCVGLSVFISKEDPTIDNGESKAGWRAGAHKVCLSHLTTEAGESLLVEKAAKTKAEPVTVEEIMTPLIPAAVNTVTWEALAHVAQAAQIGGKKSGQEAITKLIKVSRSLMTTTEIMKSKLILAQEKLLAVQEHAIRELMGVADAMEAAEVTDNLPEEDKPIMGFSQTTSAPKAE